MVNPVYNLGISSDKIKIKIWFKWLLALFLSDPPCTEDNTRFFWLGKCLILAISLVFLKRNNIWKIVFKLKRLILDRPDKAFKDTVVNRALPSLHRGSLEITHTVPLNLNFYLRMQNVKVCHNLVKICLNKI